jgi:signal transduction histidine kinase
MTPSGFALLGLTGLVAALVLLLLFAMVRFASAARASRQHLRETSTETAFLSAALQDAVTRLKAQERAMTARAEASERLSDEIVASLTAGLLVVDLQGIVRILNPAGGRMLGCGTPPAGQTYDTLLGTSSPLSTLIAECLSTQRTIVRRSMTFAGPHGTTHLGVTASPLLDGEGKPSGAICLFTDLTAIVELEEQLRLKDTLARLGELTAGLAHEFRNGLSTIHGYARLVNLESLGPKDRQYVEGIRSETDALGEVVTNFLSFARPAELLAVPVDLQTVVSRAADEIREEATARGGVIEIDGTFPQVDGDEVLLRQAFSNLLRNAIQACAEAGTPPRITVDGRVEPEHRLAHVRVSDNGPGIDSAVRDKIFRPFFTTRRDGTGLGLALVQKIVVTHNGRVSVSQQVDGGTAFDISLPFGRKSAG